MFQSIFGQGTDTPTYESLKKRRELADMLAQSSVEGGSPRNWQEGLLQGGGAIAKALMSRHMDKKLKPQEDAMHQQSLARLMAIQGGLGAQGISPDQLQGLSGIADAPGGIGAVAKSLMRRQMTPGLAEGDIPPDIAAKYASLGSEQPRPDGWEPWIPEEPGPSLEGPPNQFAMAVPQKRQPRWSDPDAPEPWIPEEPGPSLEGPPNQFARMSGSGQPLMALAQTSGPQYAQADTGTMTDAGTSMKLTEGQSKDLNFWNRMDAVTGEVDAHIGDLTAMGEKMKDSIPLVGNMMVSDGYQVGRRAANEWITALLRKDTGAAVTPEEWSLYGPIYIPQPGDGEPVLKAKTEARARAAAGMKKGLGTAEVLAQELLAARQQAAKPAPTQIDGYTIEAVD